MNLLGQRPPLPHLNEAGTIAVGLFFAMPVAALIFLAWMYRDTGSVMLTRLTHLSINVATAFMSLSSEDIGNLWPQAAYTLFIVALAVFAGFKLARSTGRSPAPRRTRGLPIGNPIGGWRMPYDRGCRLGNTTGLLFVGLSLHLSIGVSRPRLGSRPSVSAAASGLSRRLRQCGARSVDLIERN